MTRHVSNKALRKMDINSPDQTPTVIGSEPQLRFGKIEDFGSRVKATIDAAKKYLFSQQHDEGYWCGELEADTVDGRDTIAFLDPRLLGGAARLNCADEHAKRVAIRGGAGGRDADDGAGFVAPGPHDAAH